MKKHLSLIAALFLLMPAFSAVISVARTKPAEIDLKPAKTISFTAKPDMTSYSYVGDQTKLLNKLIAELEKCAVEDGRFTVLQAGSTKADVQLVVAFDSFSVSDDGITATHKINGETIVDRDEWRRAITAEMSVTAVKTETDEIIVKETKKFFAGNSNPVPKANLPSPFAELSNPVTETTFLFAHKVFNTPYYEVVNFMDTKSKDKAVKEQMKAAFKAAKAKNYDVALDSYKAIYEETQDASAGFNYARMLQIVNRFDESEAMLNSLRSDENEKQIKKAFESLNRDKSTYAILESRK